MKELSQSGVVELLMHNLEKMKEISQYDVVVVLMCESEKQDVI